MAKSRPRYSEKASDTVESAMRRRKRGTLRSSSGAKVTSRKQAIAIGLSEAREKGARVPSKPTRASASSRSRSHQAKRERRRPRVDERSRPQVCGFCATTMKRRAAMLVATADVKPAAVSSSTTVARPTP